MTKFISFSTSSIGLEHTPEGVKVACASHQSLSHIRLLTLQPKRDNVKQLYIGNPIITTGLQGKEVLVRFLSLPLTKEKDIQEAMIFQAEPLLPYAIDQAFLTYQIISKNKENTDLTLLAARKENIQNHIEFWQSLQIEPEKIASTVSALYEFGIVYLPKNKNFLIFHLQSGEATSVLIKDGKLWASFNYSDENSIISPQNGINSHHLELQEEEPLFDALKRIKKEFIKTGYALAKACKNGELEGILLTGEAADWKELSQDLTQNLDLPLMTYSHGENHSCEELLAYAVPIGLAFGSLSNQLHCMDFRQQEFSYPKPWRRFKTPVTLYFISILLLTCAFYFSSSQYLQNKENQLKQSYIDLLADMNKSHEDFEIAFVTKSRKTREHSHSKIPKIEELNQEDLMLRLAFLQKELQSIPDSFPLFANIPRVSDILAWLSQHQAVVSIDEKGHPQARLQIENFAYIMLKRPQQGKKQEKYQVKIELEFSSPTPKWAREFHDALIAPNDWIDSKGEVKWSSNRGKYKTSFFLKDKTTYPSF